VNRINKICIIILSSVFISHYLYSLQAFGSIGSFVVTNSGWKVFDSENFSQVNENNQTFYRLNENSVTRDSASDLIMDFEGPLSDIQNYKLEYNNFILNKYEKAFGNYSGKFFSANNFITLLPKSTSMFYPGNKLGSFTISFWLYLYKDYDNQYIVKYDGNNLSDESDSKIYGLSVYIKDKKVVYDFNNFFYSEDNEAHSFTITEDNNVNLDKWEHHAVTFDIKNGQLTSYKDGIEQQVEWVTADNNPRSAILNPVINEKLGTTMVIGKNAVFSLDNLVISGDPVHDFYLKKYNNKNSYIVTDVYKISDNLTTLKKISFDFEQPDYSFVKLAYRISDSYFTPDNNQIKWIYIQNNIDRFPGDYQDGKYLQFKILAYPYIDMDKPVTVKSITVDHSIDPMPYMPTLLAITPMDSKIKVSWVPSPDENIKGYEIYYGNHAAEYLSEDAVEGKSPIFVPATNIDKLQAMDYTMSGLVNEKPYFVAVRALDNRGNLSPYSKEFYARPSTVYNDSNYSVGR